MTLMGPAFNARALLIGTRLDLRSWPEAETLARKRHAPLVENPYPSASR